MCGSLNYDVIFSPTSQSVFLVGGFAASDWLFSRLQAYLEKEGIKLSRPDSHVYVIQVFYNNEPNFYRVATKQSLMVP